MKLQAGAVLALIVAGCAGTPPINPPATDDAIKPPAGSSVYLEALATGVQIYECRLKAGTTSYEWTFVAPEATLASRAGAPLGRHYAGPSWESAQGQKIVGEVKGRQNAPAAGAIPWLLLTTKSARGSGSYADAKFIQRVDTAGGIAPATGCDAGTAGGMSRVPYTATYYFYR
jgi:hypothetical protein